MVLNQENDFVIFNFVKPILLINIKKEAPTPAEWEWTKNTMICYYNSLEMTKSKISIIFDLNKLGLLDISIFREWSNLFIEYKSHTEKYIHRTSLITNSIIIKTSLNLFFKIYTTVRPMKFVDNFIEAREFVLLEFPK